MGKLAGILYHPRVPEAQVLGTQIADLLEQLRRLQDLRRDAGLEVSDRIHVTYRAAEPIAAVIASHGAFIAEEVLALSLEAAPVPEGDARVEADIDGVAAVFALRKA